MQQRADNRMCPSFRATDISKAFFKINLMLCQWGCKKPPAMVMIAWKLLALCTLRRSLAFSVAVADVTCQRHSSGIWRSLIPDKPRGQAHCLPQRFPAGCMVIPVTASLLLRRWPMCWQGDEVMESWGEDDISEKTIVFWARKNANSCN